MQTSPASGCSSPAITRSSVDFPLPLGPSSAVSEPLSTSTETSSSAVKSPKRFVTFRTSIAISARPFGASVIASERHDGEEREHDRRRVRACTSNAWKRSSTWSVIVSVRPAMRPETTLTAPNSPSARAVVRTTP